MMVVVVVVVGRGVTSRLGAKNFGAVDSPTDIVTHPAADAASVRSGERSSSHAASSMPKSTRSVPAASARALPALELTSELIPSNADAGSAATAVGYSETSCNDVFGPGSADRFQTKSRSGSGLERAPWPCTTRPPRSGPYGSTIGTNPPPLEATTAVRCKRMATMAVVQAIVLGNRSHPRGMEQK